MNNTEFRVGDIVQRVKGTHIGMKVGDIDTVVTVNAGIGRNGIMLKRDYLNQVTHDSRNFKLIKRIGEIPVTTIMELAKKYPNDQEFGGAIRKLLNNTTEEVEQSIQEKFKAFLKNHKAFGRYNLYVDKLRNVKINDYLNSTKPLYFIIDAFDWWDTTQGVDYWDRLNDKWEAELKKLIN